MISCRDCANYQARIIPHPLDGGRYAEFCSLNGSSISYMRDKDGECGIDGRCFVSIGDNSTKLSAASLP